MAQAPGYFHLHLISDATGETLITVARAAAAQYAKVQPVEHVHPLVRTQKQLDRALADLEESPGIVLYTLLEKIWAGGLRPRGPAFARRCLPSPGPVLNCSKPTWAPKPPI